MPVEEFDIWSPTSDAQLGKRALTKVDVAYHLLRNEIFQGTLAPSASLDQEAIASRLGLSTTPVREALRRLESEKLVISRSHRDTIVAPVSIDLLEKTYAVRLALDPMAVGFAAERATDEQLAQIEKLCIPPTYSDPVADLYRNRALHRAIYAACGNATLVEILDMLWDRSDRYRLIVLRTKSTATTAHQDHEAIVRAVLARDAKRAADLMARHLAASPGEIRRQTN
ncbi:MAG TPA: GntR family transcriptional regulator [Trebonia sp.]|nr:GntR family transcriptional regulator [Trebonia sp.]